MASLAPTTVNSAGQIVATGLPPQHTGFTQNIEGGLLEAASAKTSSSISAQATQAKGLGVTMRGSSRKFKFMKGGNPAKIPIVPEAHSIPGVSADKTHLALVDGLNDLKTARVYDGLVNSQPYKVGGKRKHGRSHKRTNRRRHRVNTRRSTKRNLLRLKKRRGTTR